MDKAISFKTAKFDFSSDLPTEYNAGNRFYGRDAAAYFCEKLKGKGLERDGKLAIEQAFGANLAR